MSEEKPVYHIRPLRVDDRNWVAEFLDAHWYSTKIVTRGQMYYGHLLPGFAVIPGTQEKPVGKPLGLLIYRPDGNTCEIMTLNSLLPGHGVGKELLDMLRQAASEAGYKRLWVIVTNDNMDALRFFQQHGFRLMALHVDALIE
ncbi:MAG TPA: GNAT family N-acetyltransferase, partial [Phototrophicaceae bacterium]|nr:GNAT family N-acetyltransferase [Phototrophicaceae bacterium]